MANTETQRAIEVCAAAAMASAKICATLKAYDVRLNETDAAAMINDINLHTEKLMQKIDSLARTIHPK